MEMHKVGPYVLGRTLGAGATGKVRAAFHRDTGFQVAVKIVEKASMKAHANMQRKLEREIAIMKLISHQNVLQLFEVFETADHLFLILEHAPNGELFDYLVQKGALDANEALRLFQQIVEGLAYCHSYYICHRDLKPENLLMDASNNIKIADFGMAALTQNRKLETSCGSPHYASPEVVMGQKYDGLKADVWSCGVILYALVTGKLPFDDENIRKLLHKVKSGVFTMPQFLNRDLQDLISKMLTVDPEQRISIHDVRTHPWYLRRTPRASATPKLSCSLPPIESLDAIDSEVLKSIRALGCAETDEALLAELQSPKENLTKGILALLDARRLDPPVPAVQYKSDYKKLARVKSDTKIDEEQPGLVQQPNTARPTTTPKAAEDAPDQKKKRNTLTRRRSLGAAAFMGIKAQMRSLTSSEESPRPSSASTATSTSSSSSSSSSSTSASSSSSSSSTTVSSSVPSLASSSPDALELGSSASSPRRPGSWFISMLNKSHERFAGKFTTRQVEIVQYGFFSDRPIDKLSARLMRAMDELNISYTASSNNTRFKAKFADGNDKTRTLRFDVAIISNTDDIGRLLHYVLCRRKQGQKLQFATLYAQLEESLQALVIEVDADIRAVFESITKRRKIATPPGI